MRDATPEDAGALIAIWGDSAGRTGTERFPVEPPLTQTARAIARVAASADERLIVAVLEDEVVGFSHLFRGPLSPIHTETAVHITHLHVFERARRHGVGRALVEASVSWAEEKDTTHVLAAASTQSRDANRFLARLGFGQIAVVRGATVAALRAKLPVEPPAAARVRGRNHRSVGQVLAQRRSMRRAQAKLD